MSYPESMRTICKICGEKYLYLGSHLVHKHKIRAKQYKEMFGLPHNLKLISDEIREKKQIAFEKNKEKCLKNLDSDKYRFKKGDSRHKKGLYFSDYEKKHLADRLNEKDYSGNCPICKTFFENLGSHLFNKHNLVNVSKLNKTKGGKK